MQQLVVDTENLRELSRSLGTIHRSLENADSNSDALSAMIPHDGLAQAVRDFADGWDRRRRELTDQVGQLRDASTVTADAFEGTDDQLADKILERPE